MRQTLAEDATVPADGIGFRGVTLANNTQSEDQVDAVLEQAVQVGAELVKPSQTAFWGDYSGHFKDPDDHLWEVAYNPYF